MAVIKLNNTHKDAIYHLFCTDKYMGVNIVGNWSVSDSPVNFNNRLYNIFCNNYLNDLKCFHSYGYEDNGEIKCLISFYESYDEPSWFYTLYRSSGDNNLLRNVLDEVISYNEKNGRMKFYTLVHENHSKLLRKFHWSEYNNERYGYFDEYIVPAKNKVFYQNAWELLYKRTLLPGDSTVRCNYLKNEYRISLPIGGNI
jgi:hypothetical protein